MVFLLSWENSQAAPTPVQWSYISITKSRRKSWHRTISAQKRLAVAVLYQPEGTLFLLGD